MSNLCPSCGGGVFPGREIAKCMDKFHEHNSGLVYVGLFLGERSKAHLNNIFKPKHPKVFTDHLTLAFGRHMMESRKYPVGHIFELFIAEEFSDERGHCLRVDGKGFDHLLAPNQVPHITVACADDIKPFYSNDLMKDPSKGRKIAPVPVLGILDFYPRHRMPTQLPIFKEEEVLRMVGNRFNSWGLSEAEASRSVCFEIMRMMKEVIHGS